MSWHPMVTRIAHRVAARYGLPTCLDVDDLISAGLIGLAQAYERFDPTRGAAFEAFAVPRVRGAILEAIRAADWVPRRTRERARNTGEAPLKLFSLNEHNDAEEGHSFQVADIDCPEPGAHLVAEETSRELTAAISRLPERERLIITLHYMQGVQLSQLAKSFGVTESRVSQLHTRALKMLRDELDTADVASAA